MTPKTHENPGLSRELQIHGADPNPHWNTYFSTKQKHQYYQDVAWSFLFLFRAPTLEVLACYAHEQCLMSEEISGVTQEREAFMKKETTAIGVAIPVVLIVLTLIALLLINHMNFAI